jgi:hypothetical protein
MRLLLGMLMAALLGVSATACGKTSGGVTVSHRDSTSPATNTGAPAYSPTTTVNRSPASTQRYLNDGDHDHVGDADNDNSNDNDADASLDYKPDDSRAYQDNDDSSSLAYGQPASAAQTRTLTALVKRYYATAAKDDGAGACSQIGPDLAKAVPLDYGKLGASYLHGGKTCSAVMVLLFKHFHRELAGQVHVTSVRVQAESAVAFLGSRTMSASQIPLVREGPTWRIAALLGSPLP